MEKLSLLLMLVKIELESEKVLKKSVSVLYLTPRAVCGDAAYVPVPFLCSVMFLFYSCG